MNEGKNYGRGLFYGTIGVATLVVAIIGATFAYFTATASNETEITGNMATVSLGLAVTKKTEAGDDSGLIPMSNTMVEQAVSNASGKGVCVDDNGNAVCQIYEIVLSNTSTAGIFVDGYVALINGSGVPKDYVANGKNKTTMRWAQVFTNNEGSTYTTAGTPDLGGTETNPTFAAIGANEGSDDTGLNQSNIRTDFSDYEAQNKGVLKEATISGNTYKVIGTNYIRVSDHEFQTEGSLDPTETYTQSADVTSALVYNQSVEGKGDSDSKQITYYIVVWLTETGTNQTVGAADAAAEADNFFKGQVKFTSAQGSEVSATFSGYSRVQSDQVLGG